MNYKIFPIGGLELLANSHEYSDLYIILENGNVHYSTVVNVNTIPEIMERRKRNYYWMSDMLIVMKMEVGVIVKAINEVIEEVGIHPVFPYVGKCEDILPMYSSYAEIPYINDTQEG